MKFSVRARRYVRRLLPGGKITADVHARLRARGIDHERAAEALIQDVKRGGPRGADLLAVVLGLLDLRTIAQGRRRERR